MKLLGQFLVLAQKDGAFNFDVCNLNVALSFQ